MVCVFPLPVWPYMKMVPLMPDVTASMKRGPTTCHMSMFFDVVSITRSNWWLFSSSEMLHSRVSTFHTLLLPGRTLTSTWMFWSSGGCVIGPSPSSSGLCSSDDCGDALPPVAPELGTADTSTNVRAAPAGLAPGARGGCAEGAAAAEVAGAAAAAASVAAGAGAPCCMLSTSSREAWCCTPLMVRLIGTSPLICCAVYSEVWIFTVPTASPPSSTVKTRCFFRALPSLYAATQFGMLISWLKCTAFPDGPTGRPVPSCPPRFHRTA